LSGLSPDALCRIQLTWITRISNVKFDIHFDAIKIMLLTTTQGTVCTKPLRMCSFLT
jgi:hypothetical protein